MRIRSWGARRALVASALLTLAALTVVAGGSAAPTPEASGTEGVVDVQWTPIGLRDGQATVVVQLADKPVTVVEADTGGTLSAAQKSAIQADLQAKQNGLKGQIQQLGGTVLADYQLAYNGIKVRIDRKQLGKLATLRGVTAVRGLAKVKPDNVKGVPLIGAPSVWSGLPGLHGENIKVAVIDTGIDYTHANFGGPGTTAAFEAADAADTLPPSVAHGWNARVKGGIDLVGDDYNADSDSPDYQPVPHPDPNPLDCNGHGSHVAGSAAGSGVTAAGATYTGPYNATTVSGTSWRIGPGVAPKADIYGVRVFGCDGSTDVTVDAIEWSVANDMDVINMSLGSAFGSTEDPSAVASTNAARAGVIVVTSAGNSGPSQYITGAPGTAEGAISTAAIDPSESFPAASITFGSTTIQAVNANEFPLPASATYTIKAILDDPATTVDPDGSAGTRSADESLGCDTQSFGTLEPNTIAVVVRGTCARVAKAIFGQKAGAAAVVMVDNTTNLPPIEGPITSNPDTGEEYTVTIPFLGVRGLATTPTSDGAKLRAASGQQATVTPASIANPNFRGFASFSSGGPRTGDSGLKPNIAAPGVATVSTGVGTGNGPATISGTSMASPHVAGVAALTRQAHPSWSVEDIKAAIMNTGDPSQVLNHRISRGGTGLVQPAKSTATQVVAAAANDRFAVSLNYGFEELKANFSKPKTIRLDNNGSSPATFNISVANQAGSPHTVGIASGGVVGGSITSVTVPAGSHTDVSVTLNVPVGTAGNSTAFREVAGLVTFTPATASDNNGVTLRVPYYLVPRALSQVSTTLSNFDASGNATATVKNKGPIAGDADFYAWGLEDKGEPGKAANDIRSVGVQSFAFPSAADPNRRLIVFAVNVDNRWSNAAVSEYDIPVDVNGDNAADYVVVGVDQGAVQTGSFNGVMGAFVFSERSGGAAINFLATAPHDSSTILIPVFSSALCRANEPCLSTSNPRIAYSAIGFDLTDTEADDPVDGIARFNVWSSSISQGGFATVPAGGTATVPISKNAAEWALTPALGLMIVTPDNKAGTDEAQTIKVK